MMRHWITILFVTAAFASASIGAERAKRKPERASTKSLTYASVVSFFKEARLHPTEVQKRCTVFFEGEWKSSDIYNYCLIIVENSDEDVQVTFYLTDAHEMNWISEFLDAPFFAQNETQKLFGLVSAHPPNQKEKVGRYRVDFHHWQPRHAEIFVFSFTPVTASR
jgi:hypothetical protein